MLHNLKNRLYESTLDIVFPFPFNPNLTFIVYANKFLFIGKIKIENFVFLDNLCPFLLYPCIKFDIVDVFQNSILFQKN